MIIRIEIEVEKTEGKRADKDSIIAALEQELAGMELEVDTDADEPSLYEIGSVSLHECATGRKKAVAEAPGA